jgi:hypothetical protein
MRIRDLLTAGSLRHARVAFLILGFGWISACGSGTETQTILQLAEVDITLERFVYLQEWESGDYASPWLSRCGRIRNYSADAAADFYFTSMPTRTRQKLMELGTPVPGRPAQSKDLRIAGEVIQQACRKHQVVPGAKNLPLSSADRTTRRSYVQ